MTGSASASVGDDIDVEDRFAIVPEWLLDSEISDCAVRLYAVLLRYGQSSGCRMPSRTTLAQRLNKRSKDSVDRAMRDLVTLGAVVIEPRYRGRERLTNVYRVRTSRPLPSRHPDPAASPNSIPPTAPASQPKDPAPPRPNLLPEPVRSRAAGALTSPTMGSRKFAARRSRNGAARVAATIGQYPESFTESTSPPLIPRTAMAEECGIPDWGGFVESVLAARHAAGQATGRWAGPCLDAALQLAVHTRYWPAALAPVALLRVASDPSSRSPMRVAEGGPWWDEPAPSASTAALAAEVAAAESALADLGGLRVFLQREARERLASRGLTVNRSTVALEAQALFRKQTESTNVQ